MWLRAYEAEHDTQDKRFAIVENLSTIRRLYITSRVLNNVEKLVESWSVFVGSGTVHCGGSD